MKVNDKKIIQYIKFFPFYIILVINIIFLLYLFFDFQYQLNNAKESLQINLTKEYKEKIEKETKRVIDYINLKKANNEKELKILLKEKNETAYQIINSIYEKNRDKPKKEIIKRVKTALDKMRFFDAKGYYYLMSMDGFNYFHPVFKNLENKSLLEVQDAKGLFLTKEMLKVIKNSDEGYVKYHWYKPDDIKNQYLKIAHLKRFKPLDCYVVSSDYIDSLNDKWKKDVKLFLNTIELKDNSHYFIVDKNTRKYIWNEKKELIGIKVSKANYAIDGGKVLDQLISSKNGSFHTYKVYGKNKEIISKTSYTQLIDDWDWIIGIGFYQKDIDKNIRKKQAELKEIITENLYRTLFFLSLFQ